MHQDISLITTIAAALGLSMLLGFVALRLRMPPLIGYLLAGIVIGPATPGKTSLAAQNIADDVWKALYRY